MRTLTLFVFIALCFQPTYSQTTEVEDDDSCNCYDFENIDIDTVNTEALYSKLLEIKRLNDSINKALHTDSLYQLYHYASTDLSKDHNGWYFAIGRGHADIAVLNNSLRANNMPILDNIYSDYTLTGGFVFKRKRFVHDFFMGSIHTKKSKRDQLTIKYQVLNIYNYLLGYSIINSNTFNFYPFIGVNTNFSNLTFTNGERNKPVSNITSFDSLLAFIQNPAGGNDNRLYLSKNEEIMFNYGAELDFYIARSRRDGGMMLGLRAGKTSPIFSSFWKDGKSFKDLPRLNFRDYYIHFVLKIYNQRSGKNVRKKAKGNISPYYTPY